MRRYQVYLSPSSVAILDDFEKYSDISRSKLVRAAIDRLAENLSRVFAAKNIVPSNKFIFDSLVGVLETKSRNTNLAHTVDEIYLKD